jgi:Peptide methionine sulfoxide reductase
MTTQKAILAGGCFWGMQDLIRKMPGIVSTRVGYTGGDVKNATYRNHGTHAEGIEVIYDPAIMSYRKLTILPPRTAKAMIKARAIVRQFITLMRPNVWKPSTRLPM